MSVKAKFFVGGAEHNPGQDPEHMQGRVNLNAVCRGKINAKWAASTPSGQLQMYISNPSAFRWFHDRIGKEVAITIEDANHDPQTHEFVPLENREELEESKDYYADTCAECGHPESVHT